MNLKLIRSLIIIVCLVVLSGGIGYKLGTSQVKTSWQGYKPTLEVVNKLPPDNKPVDFSLFWVVWSELQQKYVDKTKLDAQKMVYGAISGMVSSLDDPYTVFLPPQQNKESKEDLNGTFQGIGAQLGIKDKHIIVVAPLSDSPAEKAGVKTGDWIIKVNGAATANWTLPEAVSKIRGPKGSTVTLNILHPNADKPVNITIARDDIILKSVDWKIATSTASGNLKPVVYLQLARFGDQTDPQWDKDVKQINAYLATSSGKVAGLVLDVRNNPGGYLVGAVYTASEFLTSGVVVKQVSYDGTSQTYSVNRVGKLLSVPMVVLVNQGTASAGEILSGALQVVNRAKLVGMQTFGKGSVQAAEDLPNGAGLHVTEAKWLLSNDFWVNGKGLTPDYKIDIDDKDPTHDTQLDKAVEVLNGK